MIMWGERLMLLTLMFAEVIRKLEADREEVRRLSANCIKKQYDISWEANAKKMVAIYENVINEFSFQE